jgi:hypothetical protein
VKSLKTIIPQELLMTNSTIIGQPDGGDWGGLYFEVTTKGKKQYWYIDKMQTNLPEYLKPFAAELENYIWLIDN